MNLELFWTGTGLMLVWHIVSYLRSEIQEFFILRKFDSWAEELEDAKPVKKVAKKK